MTQRAKDLIRKSVQLVLMCETCKPNQYDRLWKLACGYVKKASECDCDWETLSTFERQILESRTPQTFFCEQQCNGKETTKHIVLNPIELQKQIDELEKENDKLKEYKEISEKLKNQYITLQQFQTNYQHRVTEEQSHLQNEIKRMMYDIDTTIPHLRYDVTEYEQEINKMHERLKFLCIKHREEMNYLYIELESSNLERENLANQLHNSKYNNDLLNDKNTQLTNTISKLSSELKSMNESTHIYQQLFCEILPYLDESQRTTITNFLL